MTKNKAVFLESLLLGIALCEVLGLRESMCASIILFSIMATDLAQTIAKRAYIIVRVEGSLGYVARIIEESMKGKENKACSIFTLSSKAKRV